MNEFFVPPGRVSPSPSQESLCSSKSDTDPGVSNIIKTISCFFMTSFPFAFITIIVLPFFFFQASCVPEDPDTEDRNAPFRQVPFCKYKGHTADLLDLSWSKVRHLLLFCSSLFVPFLAPGVTLMSSSIVSSSSSRTFSCSPPPWIKLSDCGTSPGENVSAAFSTLILSQPLLFIPG